MRYKAIFLIFLSTLLVACDLGRNPTADSQDMELLQDSSMDFTLTSIAPKGLELLEDSSVDFTLMGTTSNGGELTYHIVSAVPAEAGLLFLTPEGDGRFEAKPDFYGTTQFTFSVSDGQRTAAPVTVTIRVKSVPDLASARYKNAIASDTSVPWTTLETHQPQDEAVVISADGLTNLDRAFELTAEHENGDEVTFSVVEDSLPAGVSFNPDGTGTINTSTTGTGHFSFHVVIHGKNGTSAPIPVNLNTSYLIPPPTLWSYYQIDALNPAPLERTRYRLGQAANKVVFALTLANMNSVDGVTNNLQFTVNFGEIDAAEPDKVVLTAYAPDPTSPLFGPYPSATPPVLDKVPGGITATFTQADLNGETVFLVVENLGAAEVFAFDLSVVPEVKRTLRGELYDVFGGLTIPNNSIVFSPLGSIAEETATGIDVSCNDTRCVFNNPATGETGYCGYEAERGVGYPACTFLDNTDTISSACRWMYTGSTDENGYFISAYQCYQVWDFSGFDSDLTIQMSDPLVIPTYTSSIEVTVPDGGSYLGGDATYLGSIATPTSRWLLESALAGSVSQLYLPAFVSEFQAFINSDASDDPNLAAYFNALVALNLSSGDTLTRLLDDLSDPNGSNNENAATVLMAFMPKWILELTKHTREELTGDEIAIIATAMHHINVRREQLIAAAESNLEAYRSSQPQCIALSCLFAMEGFPSVIEQSVADVDAAWVGALATGAVAGTVAGVAIVAVTMAAQTTAVFIFPHTAAALAALGAAGASVGGVAALAALPVTVIVIGAVSTYMAVDNLLVAGENEQAYNAFINENSVQFTNLDSFINHDYLSDAKLLSEIVIASQKMMLEAFM